MIYHYYTQIFHY